MDGQQRLYPLSMKGSKTVLALQDPIQFIFVYLNLENGVIMSKMSQKFIKQ